MADSTLSIGIPGQVKKLVDCGDGTLAERVIADVRSSRATVTNKSGTITSGGVAQTLAAANASRLGFWIQNQSTGDLWLSSIGTASASQPSLWLPPGAYYEFPLNGVPTTAISIFGATTGQAFAAREW